MSSRTSQLLVDAFEDQGGIDYEKMWKSLVSAQEKTGSTINKLKSVISEPSAIYIMALYNFY